MDGAGFFPAGRGKGKNLWAGAGQQWCFAQRGLAARGVHPCFEESFKNTQWRKVKQMQPMRLCLFTGRRFVAHLKSHSGEKSNECNQCNFASSYANALRDHLKTHNREKSNKCSQCDFASSYASALRQHLITHSGKKPNKCHQCNYASSYRSIFRRHLKTHIGEKSNKCNQCDYASSQAGDLWHI